MPVLVVDHHHRRAVAGAEALELQQREHPGRVGLADLVFADAILGRATEMGIGTALKR